MSDSTSLLASVVNLNSLSQALRQVKGHQHYDFDQASQAYLKLGCDVLGMTTGILTRSEDGGQRIVAGVIRNHPFSSDVVYSGQSLLNEYVMQKRVSIAGNQTFTDPVVGQRLGQGQTPFVSHISCPVYLNGLFYGVVSFYGQLAIAENMGEDFRAVGDIVAQYLGFALDLKDMREILERQHQQILRDTATIHGMSRESESSSVVNLGERRMEPDLTKSFKARVLLVDDNQVNQGVLAKILKNMGYDVVVVDNGLEAIQFVRNQSVDVIFMDRAMPVMDGYEATRQIRNLPLDAQPVIIALTANVLPMTRNRCIEAGMDDYLSKPILKDSLEAVLTQLKLKAAG